MRYMAHGCWKSINKICIRHHSYSFRTIVRKPSMARRECGRWHYACDNRNPMSLEGNNDSQEVNVAVESSERRSFLGYMIGLIVSGITAVLGVTIGRYSITPALSPAGKSEWTDAGLVEDIPEGKPVKRNVVVSRTAGWAQFNSQQLVWVTKKGENVTVFSAICPHLGCTINEAAKGFICACHGSAWNA